MSEHTIQMSNIIVILYGLIVFLTYDIFQNISFILIFGLPFTYIVLPFIFHKPLNFWLSSMLRINFLNACLLGLLYLTHGMYFYEGFFYGIGILIYGTILPFTAATIADNDNTPLD